jgi:NAD(P)-dependent dehydrogenase (short-subunit alcohol dehydrogenase family)
MKHAVTQWVITGVSRGLGSSLVDAFLHHTSCHIIGVARTAPERIPNYETWQATGRYRHIQLDIASPQCCKVLSTLVQQLPAEPLGVILNAAHVEQDIAENHSLKYDVFHQVNQVGITGMGYVMAAFESHLLAYGGMVAGISSLWGTVPPLFLPWLAYPASKAYLNMAFRCLRANWRNRVNVVVIHIGNIEDATRASLPNWLVPKYSMAAEKIMRKLIKPKARKNIHYPLWHAAVYGIILRFIPEKMYAWLFQIYFKLEALQREQ